MNASIAMNATTTMIVTVGQIGCNHYVKHTMEGMSLYTTQKKMLGLMSP